MALGDGERTRAGTVMGTPSYMAPEQCLGASLVDARADLYAVGCILFEMVCGRPPFAGATGMDIIAAHLRQPPPRPREVVPEIPVELEALILLLLEKDPARRPPDALTVAERLSDCAGARDWSQAQAARWWQAHLPDLSARLAPAAEAPTRS